MREPPPGAASKVEWTPYRNRRKEAARVAPVSSDGLVASADAIYELARRIVRRERSRLRRLLGKQFVSVSVGLRTTGRKRRRVCDELTIRVVVRRKWAPGTHRSDPLRIPKAYRGRLQLGGRRQDLWVPTDVDYVRPGGPQGCIAPPVTDTTAAVRMTPSATGKTLAGSICRFVRADSDARMYLLSCKHVLSRVDAAGFGSSPHSIEVLNGSTSGKLDIGDVTSWTPGGSKVSADGALAEIANPAGVNAKIGGKSLKSWWLTPDQYKTLKVGRELLLITRRGKLPMKIYEDMGENSTLPGFDCGGIPKNLKFKRLISYVPNPGGFPGIATASGHTTCGDSGSAIVVEEGGHLHLVGIHTWGDGLKGCAQFIGDVVARLSTGTAGAITPIL